MQAYHNNSAIKAYYLARVRAHRAADEIVKGVYWQYGWGCAVGCTIHGSDHSAYERELGIPMILARLEDGIFERLPIEQARLWPEHFLEAIPVGADLSRVWPQFARWLLVDRDHGVIHYAATSEQRAVIAHVADLYARYLEGVVAPRAAWSEAAIDAATAAHSATYAAANAAYTATNAAYAATDNPADRYSYTAAAYAYAAAAAAAHTHISPTATLTARDQVYTRQAEKLLALLRAATVKI